MYAGATKRGGVGEALAFDDLTGMKLDAQGVVEARKKEIEYVKEKKVWLKIPREEAKKRGWKIIKTRWIDINKGDDANPLYRSRLVGKEFANEAVDGIFAGTPPLEALRYLIHEAATVEEGGEFGEKVLMIQDISRAFFEAKAIRDVCVEIPEEDRDPKDGDVVGHLQMSLYGTRDAAMNWQEEVARQMRAWGFRRGSYNPCLYFHKGWNVKTLVNGDDFVSVGRREDVAKFAALLEKRFGVMQSVIGRGGGDEQREGRILNRVVRVTEQGWEYEPDQRHAELIVEMLILKDANAVSTPGEDEKRWEEEENQEVLDEEKARRFR